MTTDPHYTYIPVFIIKFLLAYICLWNAFWLALQYREFNELLYIQFGPRTGCELQDTGKVFFAYTATKIMQANSSYSQFLSCPSFPFVCWLMFLLLLSLSFSQCACYRVHLHGLASGLLSSIFSSVMVRWRGAGQNVCSSAEPRGTVTPPSLLQTRSPLLLHSYTPA